MKALSSFGIVVVGAALFVLVAMLVNWGLAVLWLNKLPTCADWLAAHPEITAAQLTCHNHLQELVPVVSGILIVGAGVLIVLKLAERGEEAARA